MRIKEQMLKMRVHKTGRNQPDKVADAPIPKSITPKARVAIIAQRTPLLNNVYPGVWKSWRISLGLVEASRIPRIQIIAAPICPTVTSWCRMKTARIRVKTELVDVSGLTSAIDPVSNAREKYKQPRA